MWWKSNAQELSTGPNYSGNISEDLKVIYDEKLQNITGLMIWQKIQICFVHIEKEAKWKPQETFIETFSWNQTIGIIFTSESTLHVSQVYSIRSFRMGCKEHNRENALTKVIKCNEDNTVLLCKVTIRASGPDLET